jgi:hypothetical protein
MTSKIVYTVCAANHLAYAKTMADSFIKHNPDYTIFIGLVDRVNNRFDVSFFNPYKIIPVEELQIEQFSAMSAQYSIIELNCAIKPFMAQFLFKKYQPEILLYLDSDIFIYNSFASVETALQQNDILLTPHYTTPINDDLLPRERDVIRSGLYNAGFIAMKKSKTVNEFLAWWAERMINQCYYNFAEGMGVDQTWLNFVPLYFPKVGILNHKGCNVAYWNLHERNLEWNDSEVGVNNNVPLIFLHISGYSFNTPNILSRHQTRFDLEKLPLLQQLLQQYKITVEKNGYEKFSVMDCYFSKPKKKSTGLMATVNKIIKPLRIKITDL